MKGKEIIGQSKHIPKAIIITYIICIISIVTSIFIIDYRIEKEKPNATDLASEAAIGTETEKYVYMQIEGLTEMVASYGTDGNEQNDENEKYYLALNQGYFYVVNLDTTGLEELKSLQDYTYGKIENKPAPVTVYGITEDVPDELKEKIVEYFNELYPDLNITIDEFEQYFGSVLLNTRRDPVDVQIETIIITFAIITLFVTIVMHIMKIITKKKLFKYLEKNGYVEEVEKQLDDNIEESLYNDKIIITKDYIVDKTDGLVIIKFSDIKWIYTHKIKYYGFVTYSDMIIHLNDGKTMFKCGCVRGNITNEFEEVFEKICSKVPNDALKGYTQENIKEYKEYKKSKK